MGTGSCSERHGERRYRGGEKKKSQQRGEERGTGEGQGGTRMQKRGGRALRARDSPQLSLLALLGEFASSDASFSFSPPLLFCNSGRLAVLHLREYVGVLQDEASYTRSLAHSRTTRPYRAVGDTYRPCGARWRSDLPRTTKGDPSSPGETGSLLPVAAGSSWPDGR